MYINIQYPSMYKLGFQQQSSLSLCKLLPLGALVYDRVDGYINELLSHMNN